MDNMKEVGEEGGCGEDLRVGGGEKGRGGEGVYKRRGRKGVWRGEGLEACIVEISRVVRGLAIERPWTHLL